MAEGFSVEDCVGNIRLPGNAVTPPADEQREPSLGEEELALPSMQPDRAWAEHLGMPRLIAALRAKDEEIKRLQEELSNSLFLGPDE